jgi:hypothetical protein
MPNTYHNGLVQIRPQYSADSGDTPENVLWFQASVFGDPYVPFSTTDLANIAAVFDPAWGNLWKYTGNSSCTYDGSILTAWDSDTGPEYNNTLHFTAVPGQLSGDQLPNQVAVLVNWTTTQRYRGGHPRFYLPNQDINVVQYGSNVSPSYLPGLQTRANTLVSDMAGLTTTTFSDFQPVNFRFRSDAAKVQVIPLVGVVVNPKLATQRRRLRKETRHA